MKKLIILGILLLLILIMFLTFLFADTKEDLAYRTHTKAICNETNYCQDYQITCNKEKVVMMTPITGAFLQLSETWKDPRNEAERELC